MVGRALAKRSARQEEERRAREEERCAREEERRALEEEEERDFQARERLILDRACAPPSPGSDSSACIDATYKPPTHWRTKEEEDPLSSPGSDSSREGARSKAIKGRKVKLLSPHTVRVRRKERRVGAVRELCTLRGGRKAGLFPVDQLGVDMGGVRMKSR